MEARAAGQHVRGMVFINPGNPTGQCLSKDNLKVRLLFFACPLCSRDLCRLRACFNFRSVECQAASASARAASRWVDWRAFCFVVVRDVLQVAWTRARRAEMSATGWAGSACASAFSVAPWILLVAV